MKKAFICLTVILLLLAPAVPAMMEAAPDAVAEDAARTGEIDLSVYSIEELIDLQTLIQNELIGRGYNPYYDLDRNDKGESVARLQERLQELGYFSGSISGKYDSVTAQALKQFEKANGLKNDGKASREDQMVLFSADAIAKPAPAPKPTFAPGGSDAPLDIDPNEYGTLDYSSYYRNPENYKNEKVALTGSVYQVMGSRANGFRLLFTVGGNNVYVIVPDPGYNIMENDRLTIYARMNGTYTYTSTMHAEITVPLAYADAVVLR